MKKRGQINLPVILLSVLMIIILAGLGYLIYQYYSDTYVDCGIGKLKTIDGKKVCVFNVSSTIICPSGFFYNSTRNICVFEPQTERVCNQGIYNPTTGNCEININTSYICSNGVLEFAHNEWRCRVEINNTRNVTDSGLLTCSQYGKSKCINGQICNGTVKLAADTANCCSGVCVDNTINPINPGNNVTMPYVIFRTHNHDASTTNWPDKDFNNRFVEMEKTIALFDKYNASLTIGFGIGWVKKILENQTKVDIVRQWQANGHEIGIEHHCASHGGWDGYSNVPANIAEQFYSLPYSIYHPYAGSMEKYYAKFEELAGKPVKTADMCMKSQDMGGNIVYVPDGQPKAPPYIDSRISKATVNKFNGELVYYLNIQSGYNGETPWDSAFEKCVKAHPSEICGFVAHDEDFITSSRDALEEVLKYFYDIDNAGSKIMTVSELMETYVIPNDLIIHERCGNTACDQEEFDTGSCPQDCDVIQCNKCSTVNCAGVLCLGSNSEYCTSVRDGRFQMDCEVGHPHQIYLMGRVHEACGDNVCNYIQGETPKNCLSDCYGCGDYYCDAFEGETSTNCENDCKVAGEKTPELTCYDLDGTKCINGSVCSVAVTKASDTKNCCVGTCS